MQEPVHRQQLNRRHADLLQMRDHRVRPKASKIPPIRLGHPRMPHRRALWVGFPDQRHFPAVAQRLLGVPVEVRVHHHRLRHERPRVAIIPRQIVTRMPEDRRVPHHLAPQLSRIGVQQQLGRVETMPRFRLPGAMHPIAVDLPRPHPRQIAEPDPALHFGQVQLRRLGLAVIAVET